MCVVGRAVLAPASEHIWSWWEDRLGPAAEGLVPGMCERWKEQERGFWYRVEGEGTGMRLPKR